MSYSDVANTRDVIFYSPQHAAGKTALLQVLRGDVYSPHSLLTIGVDFFSMRNNYHHNSPLRLRIIEAGYDACRRQGFRDIGFRSLNSTDLLVCCLDSRQRLTDCLDQLLPSNLPPQALLLPRILVITKCDDHCNMRTSFQEFDEYARANGFIRVIRVSAQTGSGIAELEECLFEQAFTARPPSPVIAPIAQARPQLSIFEQMRDFFHSPQTAIPVPMQAAAVAHIPPVIAVVASRQLPIAPVQAPIPAAAAHVPAVMAVVAPPLMPVAPTQALILTTEQEAMRARQERAEAAANAAYRRMGLEIPAPQQAQAEQEEQLICDSELCVVCLCERRNTVFIPCGHYCACNFCAQQCLNLPNRECPYCRTKIERIQTIYKV